MGTPHHSDLAELPHELRPLRDALSGGYPPLLGETSEGTEHVETSQGPALRGTGGLVPNAREDGFMEHEHETRMVGDSQYEPVQRRNTLMEVQREEAAVTDNIMAAVTDTITIEATMVATATSSAPCAIVPHGTIVPESTNEFEINSTSLIDTEHPPRLETASSGVNAHGSSKNHKMDSRTPAISTKPTSGQ